MEQGTPSIKYEDVLKYFNMYSLEKRKISGGFI